MKQKDRPGIDENRVQRIRMDLTLGTSLLILLFLLLSSSLDGYKYSVAGQASISFLNRYKQTSNKPLRRQRHFTQKLDHFNPQDLRTWRQRYFINDGYFVHNSSAPVFLCVGGKTAKGFQVDKLQGEGPPLTDAVVTSHNIHCSNMVEIAESLRGLVVAVEHRFYGTSLPLDDFSTDSLRFLSSHQALYDLANIHEYISRIYGLKRSENPWFAFGGSYPGMLASFFRIKFPHLCWAAIASSAPVHAISNFKGYSNIVARSFANTRVGGSEECKEKVKMAFEKVGEMMQSVQGQAELEEKFNICRKGSLSSFDNQAIFAEFLTYIFPVQSNDPSCAEEACNIQKICNIMRRNDGNPYESLLLLNKLDRVDECVEIDADKEKEQLRNASIKNFIMRPWIYQTCTEFGFFQTCDPDSECIFITRPHYDSVESSFKMCKEAFNIDSMTIKNQIKASNLQYGGLYPRGGSRIFYPNGEIDPWIAASITNSIDDELVAFIVEGASHHFWTHEPRKDDSVQVKKARNLVKHYVVTWLNDFYSTRSVSQQFESGLQELVTE